MKRFLFFIMSFISVITFAQQPVELPLWPGGAPNTNGLTEKEKEVSHLQPMIRVGKSYLGTKYVANTLDESPEEKLVIQPQKVDCLTFVEYVLAQALSSDITRNLQNIRYRDGIIDGYPSDRKSTRLNSSH